MKTTFLNNLIAHLRILSFVALVISSFSARGQADTGQGYVITVQGDTLRGKVKVDSDMQLTLTDANAVKKIYTPEEVKEAYSEGLYYTVENVNGSKRYLQQVIEGYTSLYRFKNFKTNESFYLKLNDTILAVTKNLYPGITNALISECNDGAVKVTEAAPEFRYSLKGLSELVSYYNTCKGFGDKQVVKYVPQKIQLKPRIYFGPGVSQFKFGEENRYTAGEKFEPGIAFTAGVSVKFGDDSGLSFRPGIQFSHKSGKVEKLPVPVYNYTTVDIDLNTNFIEAPLLLRYTFEGKSYKPFVTLGPHIGASINSEIERTPHGFSYREGVMEYSNLDLKWGLSGGVGIFFEKVHKGMEIELRGEKSTYANDVDLRDLKSSSIQFLVGFYINK